MTVIGPQKREKGEHGARFVTAASPYRRGGESPAARKGRSALFGTAARIADIILMPDRLAPWALKAAGAAERLIKVGGPPDALLTTSPPESVHLAGLRLKRKYGVRWIADFRDGWTVEPLRPETSWPIRGLIEARIERKVLQAADTAGFVSLMARDGAARKYPSLDGKLLCWPTGFDTGAAPRHAPNKKFTLMYTGRLSLSHKARSINGLLSAIRGLAGRNKDFGETFTLVFHGLFSRDEAATISSLAEPGLASIRPPVDPAEMPKILSGADALLLVTAPGHLTAAPRKIFDYLAARRPILALTGESEAARIIRETESGVAVPPGDTGAVAEALENLWLMWREGRLERNFPFTGAEKYRADRLAESFFKRAGIDI